MTEESQTETLQETARKIIEAFQPLQETIEDIGREMNEAVGRALKSEDDD